AAALAWWTGTARRRNRPSSGPCEDRDRVRRFPRAIDIRADQTVRVIAMPVGVLGQLAEPITPVVCDGSVRRTVEDALLPGASLRRGRAGGHRAVAYRRRATRHR